MNKAPTYAELVEQSREAQRVLADTERKLAVAVARVQRVPVARIKPLTLPRNALDQYHRQFGMAAPAPEKAADAVSLRAVSRQRRRAMSRGSRANAGLEAMYRQKLETKLGEMNASVLYWLRSAYRNNPPEMARDGILGRNIDSGDNHRLRLNRHKPSEDSVGDQNERTMANSVLDDSGRNAFGAGGPAIPPDMEDHRQIRGRDDISAGDAGMGDGVHDGLVHMLATDRSPASIIKTAFDKLAKRWLRQFDDLADGLGKWFAIAAHERSDAALRQILRRGGMAVPFQMTPEMRDVMHATVNENVSLIRSIPQQYFTQVEGSVMRSVTAGRDLASLTTELREHYGVTKKRAKLIAMQQNNAATAAFTRVRQVQYGLKAIWMHSSAGKTYRPTHVANNGKTYDPTVGWYDPAEKKHIFPGQLINCRCFSKTVIPGFAP